MPTLGQRRLAALAMLVSVAIYGVNFVVSRYATLNGFTPYDIAALRFGLGGFLMLPLFLRAGGFADCAGVGWGRGLVLCLMSGIPMTMLQIIGVSLAPAAHGATIGPGTVTVISVVGGVILFGAVVTGRTKLGLSLALAGLFCFALGSGLSGTREIILGDLCFLAMALLWGGYPLALQKWKVDPLVATAVLSVISFAYVPVWWAFLPSNLGNVPLWIVAAHAFNQAVLNLIVGLWLWGYAARTMGASWAGRFPPLIPVIGTLTAIPVLGEWPGPLQALAIFLIVFGLLVMSIGKARQD
ncbi:MAG: DMT family transporter [Beijerinckiaceae bacterium]